MPYLFESLYSKYKDLFLKDKFKNLELIILFNRKNILKFVVRSGYDINTQDSSGNSILHKSMFQKTSKEMIQTLLTLKANVNLLNSKSRSPAHYCILNKKREIFNFL